MNNTTRPLCLLCGVSLQPLWRMFLLGAVDGFTFGPLWRWLGLAPTRCLACGVHIKDAADGE